MANALKDKGGRTMVQSESHGNSDKFSKSVPSVQAPRFQTEAKPETIRGPEALRSKHEHQTSQEGVELRRLSDSPLHCDGVGRKVVVTDLPRQQHGVISGSSKAEVEAPKGSDALMQRHRRRSSHEDNNDLIGGVSSGNTPKRTTRQSAGTGSVEQSPLHPHHQARVVGRSSGAPSPSRERRSSSEGGSHGLAPSTPWRSRPRSATRGDETPDQGAAVPKFGEWDESNPSSADGYSLIFNRVREERQSGVGRVPGLPNESSHSNGQERYDNRDFKRCFCFPWGRK